MLVCVVYVYVFICIYGYTYIWKVREWEYRCDKMLWYMVSIGKDIWSLLYCSFNLLVALKLFTIKVGRIFLILAYLDVILLEGGGGTGKGPPHWEGTLRLKKTKQATSYHLHRDLFRVTYWQGGIRCMAVQLLCSYSLQSLDLNPQILLCFGEVKG